ncbi:hypothetical protein LA080_007184 [Diaporthe eres]|nr:hypothetical protein LA080_007184 [Diaporthe eres]
MDDFLIGTGQVQLKNLLFENSSRERVKRPRDQLQKVFEHRCDPFAYENQIPVALFPEELEEVLKESRLSMQGLVSSRDALPKLYARNEVDQYYYQTPPTDGQVFLQHVHDAWTWMTLGEPWVQEAADEDTVRELELRAPHFSEPMTRQRIQEAILQMPQLLIPSIRTFQENMKWLTVGVQILKDTVIDKAGKKQVRKAMRDCWKPPQRCLVEAGRGDFVEIPAPPAFELAYRQVLIAALREFPRLSRVFEPRREKGRRRSAGRISPAEAPGASASTCQTTQDDVTYTGDHLSDTEMTLVSESPKSLMHPREDCQAVSHFPYARLTSWAANREQESRSIFSPRSLAAALAPLRDTETPGLLQSPHPPRAPRMSALSTSTQTAFSTQSSNLPGFVSKRAAGIWRQRPSFYSTLSYTSNDSPRSVLSPGDLVT